MEALYHQFPTSSSFAEGLETAHGEAPDYIARRSPTLSPAALLVRDFSSGSESITLPGSSAHT